MVVILKTYNILFFYRQIRTYGSGNKTSYTFYLYNQRQQKFNKGYKNYFT